MSSRAWSTRAVDRNRNLIYEEKIISRKPCVFLRTISHIFCLPPLHSFDRITCFSHCTSSFDHRHRLLSFSSGFRVFDIDLHHSTTATAYCLSLLDFVFCYFPIIQLRTLLPSFVFCPIDYDFTFCQYSLHL